MIYLGDGSWSYSNQRDISVGTAVAGRGAERDVARRQHVQVTAGDQPVHAAAEVGDADARLPSELALHANRNGFFYVLDRETGTLLLAEPFITKDGSTIREYFHTGAQSLAEAQLAAGGSTRRSPSRRHPVA